MKARITGIGSYLPKQVLTNKDFERMVKTSHDWIVSRTGITERRIAGDDEFPSTMGIAAAKQALEDAQLGVESIDLILGVTSTPDYQMPSTAALIQEGIGARNVGSMDLQAACSGYIYGLSVAKAYIESKLAKHVLVVATEKISSFIDYTDRTTSVIFGDGAAAAVVSDCGPGFEVEEISLGTDGSLANLIIVPAGGSRKPATHETVEAKEHTLRMEGKEVFKHAVRRMVAASEEVLEKAGIKPSDIEWIVPHQANVRILDAVAKQFNFPSDQVYKTVHKYGNSSASSLGIALRELSEEQSFKEGSHLLLVAFGAGLSWGAAILTYREGT